MRFTTRFFEQKGTEITELVCAIDQMPASVASVRSCLIIWSWPSGRAAAFCSQPGFLSLGRTTSVADRDREVCWGHVGEPQHDARPITTMVPKETATSSCEHVG